MNAITVNQLQKSFDGKTNVLKKIDLTIPEGEIFGFLGPNGSGKTTTVRVLNGILEATGGSAEIMGIPVEKNQLAIHRLCGVMTETAQSYFHLTTEQNLLFFGRMHNMEETVLQQRIVYLLMTLELTAVKAKKVSTLSTGMKKRVSLAIALVHDPKVLFLDEPTSGLDPESARNVTRLIKQLADENKVTIFLCTHQLKYAEEMCTLYGFISDGEILGFGTFDELAAQKNAHLQLKIRGANVPENLGFTQQNPQLYTKSISGDEETNRLVYEIINSGGEIYEVNQQKWTLEQLYFMYIKGAMSKEVEHE